MSSSKTYKVAIVWRGDAAAREAATPQNNRFYRVEVSVGDVLCNGSASKKVARQSKHQFRQASTVAV
jgi:hypothetical protein